MAKQYRRPQTQKPKTQKKSEFRNTGPTPKGPRYNRAKSKRNFDY